MKISFFIARQSISGVPLAQIRLAKAFQRKGHEVEFVVGYVPDEADTPKIPGIRVTNLNRPRTYRLLFPIAAYLRKTMPDIIFSAEDHVNAIVTLAVILVRSRAKLSVSSRVTPLDTYSNRVFTKRWVLKQMNKILWRRADALVCVSEDMVKQYEKIFGPTRFQCIYNVICDSELEAKMAEGTGDSWIEQSPVPLLIAVGRLAPEKGYPNLIRAFAIVRNDMDVRLAILGDGPERRKLESIIDKAGLGDSIKLLGFQSNPYKFYKRAEVSVLSSYVEGLPNVLVEAMACGVTPVATNCPTGPAEVLNGGEYGYLVPVDDPESMAEAIKLALSNPVSPETLQRAIFPFTETEVVKKHRKVLGF